MAHRSSSSAAALPAALLGLSIAAGLTVSGFFLADALTQIRAAERIVTVKGLAERDVPADLAIWPIVFTVAGDELGAVQTRVEAQLGLIRRFLLERGFVATESTTTVPRITDLQAQLAGAARPPAHRFLAEATLTLRSGRVDAVRAAMQDFGQLVAAGVVLMRSYEARAQFLFTSLEAIKPEMIAAATRDARRAARQFAADSGSAVGSIRRARQGYFTVADRDPFSPEFKTVRVVTTVDYFLVDNP
jgi:hypothetical protein